MGFRNPFRIQVDENDVAYVTDYSPDSQVPEKFRGPAGTGRVEVVRKPANYGWPLCVSPDLPYYRWNFNTSTPLDAPAAPHECGNPDRGPAEHLALEPQRRPDGRARPRVRPPVTQPDIWYSYRDNTDPAARHAVPGVLRRLRAAAPARSCSRSSTRAASARTAPPKYHYDAGATRTRRSSRRTTTTRSSSASSRRTRCARSGSTRKQAIFKINNLLDCGDFSATRDTKPFECDNPMDMQFGADGAFYLLTYGDGFFTANPDAGMYRFDYVKGQRAPQAVLERDADQRPGAAHACASPARDARPRPGRLDRVRVGLRRQRHGRLDRPRTRRTSTPPTASTPPS